MQRSSVDLPDPDAPISATAPCSGTLSETPRSTSRSPNAFVTPTTSRTARVPTAARPAEGRHVRAAAGRRAPVRSRHRSRSLRCIRSTIRASGIVTHRYSSAAAISGV